MATAVGPEERRNMASQQAERVSTAIQKEPGRAASRRHTGTCVGVAQAPGSTTLTVRLSSGNVDVVLPAAPDPALAGRLTGGFRRVSWVSIDTSGERARCEVAALSRRPQRLGLPLAAALALAGRVPTLVRVRDRVA